MSNDDYANHMIQKYRLAISIAVIKTKPENITLEQYIQLLRNNISKEKSNSDNLSISLCSDDFQIDETGKFDSDTDENTDNTNSFNDKNAKSDKNINKTDENNERIDKDCTKITDQPISIDLTMDIDKNIDVIETHEEMIDVTDEMFRQNEINDVEMIDTQDLNDSLTILNNFEKVNDMEAEERRNLNDVMAILNDIDVGMTSLNMKITNKQTKIDDSTNLHVKSSDITKSIKTYQHSITDKHTSNSEKNNIYNNTEQTNNHIYVENVNKTELLKQYRHTKQFDNIYQNVANIFGNEFDIFKEQRDKAYVKDINKDGQYSVNEIINDTEGKTYDTKDTSKNEKYDVKRQNIKNEKMYVKDITDNNVDKKYGKDTQMNIRQEFTNETHFSESQTLEKRCLNDVADNTIDKRYDMDIQINIAQDKFIYETHKGSQTNENKCLEEIKDNTTNKRYDKDTQMNLTQDKFTYETYFSGSQTNEKRRLTDMTENTTSKRYDKDIQMNVTQDKFIYLTHFSESQTNDMMIIDDKYIHGINDTLERNKNKIHSNINTEDEINNAIFQDIQIIKKCNKNDEILRNNDNKLDYVNEVTFFQDSELTNLTILPKDKLKNDIGANIHNITEEIEKYNEISKGNNNKSDVKYLENDLFSQESQLTNFSINNSQNFIENSLVFSQNAQRDDEYMNIRNDTKNDKNDDVSINKNYTEFDKTFNRRYEKELNERSTNFDENSNNTQAQDILEREQVNKICTNFDKVLEYTKAPIVAENNEPVPEDCTNFDDNLANMEVEESQTELVPFKVMEELNKIKVYLNKNSKKINFEENSSDTGYKSDSQSKKSLKLSQSSIGWLDQSASSIFNYLIQRPLAATTEDITNEISKVLGQLIDKLHDEESYPSFLEELLDSVQMLLSIVYEKNTEENVLMEKDETIQRLLLLNKSVHIQKYTIEKITKILENLHTELTKADCSYETENIDHMENICYIFHLLEILLQKYNKTCQNISQNSQNLSQNTQNLSQKTQNLSQKTQNLSQKTQNLSQKTQNLSQKTQNLSQKTQNLSQKTQNLSQNTQNLSQKTQNLSQNTQNSSRSTQNSQEDSILKKSSITDIWRKKWNPNYRQQEIEDSSERKCVLTNCCTVLNKIVVDCMTEYSLISYSALKCFNVMQN